MRRTNSSIAHSGQNSVPKVREVGAVFRTPCAISLLAAALLSSLAGGEAAQATTVNPSRFGAMTCQQLWYVEQETLAEGRVCLTTERARRAFRRAPRCISSDETILPPGTRDYLIALREVARQKQCPPIR